MNVQIKVDLRDVRRSTRRLRRRTPIATAQELNRQGRQSRTLLTRGISKLLGIRPQRRIRNRILLPRGGRATKRRLRAVGLSLVEAIPARWMSRRGNLNLTAGAVLRSFPPRASAPFPGTNVAGNPDLLQRRTSGRLPVSAAMVDISTPGYAVRSGVLQKLARAWPALWEKRMRSEIRRAFR